MTHKILCVDDEPAVLKGYQRLIGLKYDLDTALGGESALEMFTNNGPYAVVISDMRMPGMNGSEFLSKVREKWPQTVRILLTGYADLADAISVVNNGKIFRYLLKPCPPETLEQTLTEAVEQHLTRTAPSEVKG